MLLVLITLFSSCSKATDVNYGQWPTTEPTYYYEPWEPTTEPTEYYEEFPTSDPTITIPEYEFPEVIMTHPGVCSNYAEWMVLESDIGTNRGFVDFQSCAGNCYELGYPAFATCIMAECAEPSCLCCSDTHWNNQAGWLQWKFREEHTPGTCGAWYDDNQGENCGEGLWYNPEQKETACEGDFQCTLLCCCEKEWTDAGCIHDELPTPNNIMECHENMEVGDMCEADRPLPSPQSGEVWNTNNCPGGYDVFTVQCKAF